MGTICPAPLLRCLVDLNVLDYQIARVQSLGIRICLSILQKCEKMLRRLDRPPSTRNTKLFSYQGFPSVLMLSTTSTLWQFCLDFAYMFRFDTDLEPRDQSPQHIV